jgi:hypothetical protein
MFCRINLQFSGFQKVKKDEVFSCWYPLFVMRIFLIISKGTYLLIWIRLSLIFKNKIQIITGITTGIGSEEL